MVSAVLLRASLSDVKNSSVPSLSDTRCGDRTTGNLSRAYDGMACSTSFRSSRSCSGDQAKNAISTGLCFAMVPGIMPGCCRHVEPVYYKPES
eukprot:2821306-Pyramimonas_sp.AAC.2